jgi:formylglycine-generating enzyme required for sulfatase activity
MKNHNSTFTTNAFFCNAYIQILKPAKSVSMKNFGLLSIFILGIFLISAGFGDKPKVKLKKTFTSKYAYVPNGSVAIEGKANEVGAFYMLKTEVSNFEYTEFLNDLKDEKLKERYSVKSENWTKGPIRGEPYSEHYHTHPAYQNYPVVNVTSESAKAYCEWLTEKYTSMDIGLPDDMRIVFRLPTRTEWVNAANGGLTGPYAWGGPFVRNTEGTFLANFVNYGARNIHRNEETGALEVVHTNIPIGVAGSVNGVADVTAPVESYAPNGFGLHQMNGNVAEILSDMDQAAGGSWYSTGYDIRNESLMAFDEASPLVGFRPIAILSKKQTN